MKLLRIDQLDPELKSPGFWTQKRLIFLQVILELCPNKTIRPATLKQIEKGVTSFINENFEVESGSSKKFTYRFKKSEQEECNLVIERLQDAGWLCSFFRLNSKKEHSSVLPTDADAYKALAKTQDHREQFWAGKIDKKINWFRQLVIEISVGNGLPFKKIQLSIDNDLFLSSPKGYITVPIAAGSRRIINIPLSAKATLLFELIKRNKILPKIDFLYLNDFLHSNFAAYRNGLESVIYAALHRKQLPVPLPMPSENTPVVFRYSAAEFKLLNPGCKFPLLIQRNRSNYSHNNQSDNVLSSIDTELKFLPELEHRVVEAEDTLNWTTECLITISSIKNNLKRFLTDDFGVYKNGTLGFEQVSSVLKDAFIKTISRAKERAMHSATAIDIPNIEKSYNEINEAGIAVGLIVAIKRIYYHLLEKKNTLDTCLNEINTIFERGILRYPTINLNAWDEEDIEILLSDFILERDDSQLKESTQDVIAQRFLSVIRYCQKEFNVFKHIELPQLGHRGIVITNRNHVLGPTEFDLLKYTSSPVLYLAFYGGLRAGEIANLTMNDVVANKSELTFYIRKGKTPAAKRAIPLHLIAPPKVVSWIRDYYEERKSYYRGYQKKSRRNKEAYLEKNEAPFISNKTNLFSPTTGVTATRQALILLQDKLGSGANLHLLRHSFASMMFLRWYCCKYPDLIDELIDKKHWCFSNDGLEKLKIFFGEDPDIPLPDSNVTAIIHLIKLMGHSNTHTFFQVYVHSFDTVLQHAIKRINEKDNESILPGSLISELIPNMKSRASHVKLKSRKIRDLVW